MPIMGLFKPKRQKEGPNRIEALQCIPVKNNQVEELRSENGALLLRYPVTIRPWLAGVFGRLRENKERTVLKKLELDTLGAEVWGLLDGNVRVLDVTRRFATKHRLPQREAEIAVTRFLRDLGKRGLIGLR